MSINKELKEKTEAKWQIPKIKEIGIDVKQFPPDFSRMLEECKSKFEGTEMLDCEVIVRRTAREWEGGRWWKGLDALSNFLSRLDKDELIPIKQDCPCLINYVNQFNRAETYREI